MQRPAIALAVLAGLIPLAATTHPSSAGAPTAAPGGSITVVGHGAGHGRGMGQYGAYGYATESGYRWGYRRILGHFYGGTHLRPTAATVERSAVDVNLSELDGASTTSVRAAAGGAHLVVDGQREPAGTITLHHTARELDIRATSGDVSVRLPAIGWRSYQGSLRIRPVTAPDGTGGQTWNVVPLEEYVAGVVPEESPASWGATGGEAALRAQAVAARSYVLAYVAAAGRTCDTTACQSYGGDPATLGLGGYLRFTDTAVTSTAGQVMCTAATSTCPPGHIVATEYSASTGGYSAGGTFPAVADAGDAVASNPYHRWTAAVRLSTITALFPDIGRPTLLLVTSRDGRGAWGGRALAVRITGTQGRSVTVSGDELAADLGLPSDWLRFADEP